MATLKSLETSLARYHDFHVLLEAYYEGTVEVPKLGISIPPVLNRINLVCGWPSTVVDVLEERLDWLGWDDDGKFGLEQVYDDNQLSFESSLIHIDTLMFGISYAQVSTGFDDEPPNLITAETAKKTTGIWNRRKRELDMAFTKDYDEEGKYTIKTLYERDRTVYYRRKDEHSPWRVVKTDPHKLGKVPIVRFINRGRAGRPEGKSEITRAVRIYTDIAVRTLLGMEVNREFFQSPQRYVLGAREQAFTDQAGNPIPGWRAILGSLWNLERDEDWANDHQGSDGLPKVGQFPANPPGPFLEQIRGLSLMLAAEAAIPPTYLGFVTENPPSSDAIRALESRLVKRAERRQTAWDPSWLDIARLCARMDGKKEPSRSDVQILWRDPATPTKAADADRAVKLTGAGILPVDSSVTYDMVGLSPREQKRLERDKMRAAFRDVIAGGFGDTGTGSNQPGNNADVSADVGEQPVTNG